MNAASRHGTPGLTYSPKDGKVICLVSHPKGHLSGFRHHTIKPNFIYLIESMYPAHLIDQRILVRMKLNEVFFLLHR